MRHISHDVGPRAALLYQEIRRCLGLRGGRTINGTKWIYKTMQDLADRFGFSVRDIQRHLKKLWSTSAGSNVSGWMQRRIGTRPIGTATGKRIHSPRPSLVRFESGKVAALRAAVRPVLPFFQE